ncbi:hypothetical protein BDD12DRAFT_828421 [Trichophaea hybrida]|nr:hypothetical protein BDD12DRAFT_828421 [Trichophaea hybrida]
MTWKRPRFSSLDPPPDFTSVMRKLPRRSTVRRRSTRPISPSFLDALSTEVTPSASQKRTRTQRISPFPVEASPPVGSISITPPPKDKGKGKAREVDIAPTPSSSGRNSRHHTEARASPVAAGAPESTQRIDLPPLLDEDDERASLPSFTIIDLRKKVDHSSGLEDPPPPAEDEVADDLFNILNPPTPPPAHFSATPPALPPASRIAPTTSARVCASTSQSSVSTSNTNTSRLQRPHNSSPQHSPAADSLLSLSPAHRESIKRWKDASRSEGSRFSGPRIYTSLTLNQPTGGCGLVLLPQWMNAELREREAAERALDNNGRRRESSPEV